MVYAHEARMIAEISKAVNELMEQARKDAVIEDAIVKAIIEGYKLLKDKIPSYASHGAIAVTIKYKEYIPKEYLFSHDHLWRDNFYGTLKPVIKRYGYKVEYDGKDSFIIRW